MCCYCWSWLVFGICVDGYVVVVYVVNVADSAGVGVGVVVLCW